MSGVHDRLCSSSNKCKYHRASHSIFFSKIGYAANVLWENIEYSWVSIWIQTFSFAAESPPAVDNSATISTQVSYPSYFVYLKSSQSINRLLPTFWKYQKLLSANKHIKWYFSKHQIAVKKTTLGLNYSSFNFIYVLRIHLIQSLA